MFDPEQRPRNAVIRPDRVEAWAQEWEIEQMQGLVGEQGIHAVLDIGTGQGHTLTAIMDALPVGGRTVAVDLTPQPRTLLDHANDRGVRYRAVEGSFTDPDVFTEVADRGLYGLVHYDADRSPGAVAAAFDQYRPLIQPGGVFAVTGLSHPPLDTDDTPMDVIGDWRAIQARGYLTREIIASPFQTWGGIGLVYP